MCNDGELFIQSDIFQLIKSMNNIIDNSTFFDRKEVNGLQWLDQNPYNTATDREIFNIQQQLPIYRAIYIRNSKLVVN